MVFVCIDEIVFHDMVRNRTELFDNHLLRFEDSMNAIVSWIKGLGQRFLLYFFGKIISEMVIRDTHYVFCHEFTGRNFPVRSWPGKNFLACFRTVSVPSKYTISLQGGSVFALDQGVQFLESNGLSRPTRGDAVLFGNHISKHPKSYKASQYVLIHKPVTGDLVEFVTIFTREFEDSWSVIVNKSRKGLSGPLLTHGDVLVGISQS